MAIDTNPLQNKDLAPNFNAISRKTNGFFKNYAHAKFNAALGWPLVDLRCVKGAQCVHRDRALQIGR
jgi:hypothetical protein